MCRSEYIETSLGNSGLTLDKEDCDELRYCVELDNTGFNEQICRHTRLSSEPRCCRYEYKEYIQGVSRL